MLEQQRFISRQAKSSAVLSVLMGGVVFFAVFGGTPVVQVWGIKGFILDCVPQGFMVGLMCTIPPSLSTRRALRNDLFPARAEALPAFLPSSLVGRAIVLALMSMTGLTIVAALLAGVIGISQLQLLQALLVKSVMTLILALIVTPLAVRSCIFTTTATA